MKNQAPKGYVEFSKPQKKVSDLYLWIIHFMKKGINTTLIQTKSGWVLCRSALTN